MADRMNLTGKRFGYLTVLHEIPSSSKGNVMWLCKCDCGNETTATSNKLSCGGKLSCGCLRIERRKAALTKHGSKHTALYRVWRNMKTRCYCPNNKCYKYYGERGITVCEEWRNDFSSFKKWAENNGYRSDLTIDRIDNNKGYSPENCRWVDMKEQNNNKIGIRKYEIDGKFYSLQEVCEKYNISRGRLYYRLKLNNSDITRTISMIKGG